MEWRDWAAGIAIGLTIVNQFISWHWHRGDRTLAFVRRKQDALRQANTNILALRNLQFMLLAMAHAKDEWLAKGKVSVVSGSLLEQHLRAMHLESGNLLTPLSHMLRASPKPFRVVTGRVGDGVDRLDAGSFHDSGNTSCTAAPAASCAL